MSNFTKLLQQAAAGSGEEMTLKSFLMSHEVGFEFNVVKKLADGRYLLINKESAEYEGWTGATDSTSHSGDHAFWVLDFTQDGYPRISRDILTEGTTVLRSNGNAFDKQLENRYFSSEIASFDDQGTRSTNGLGFTQDSFSFLSEYNLIGTTYNGYITESGTSTALVSGQTFFYGPIIHTPSYVIYHGYANNPSYSSKWTHLFSVYNKSNVKQFQFGLRATSTSYNWTFSGLKELSNGNLLVWSNGIGGVSEITTSGTLRWNHWNSNGNLGQYDFVESGDYIYVHAGTQLRRFDRTNGTLNFSTTNPSTSYVHVGSLTQTDTFNNHNGIGSHISVDTDGSIYMSNFSSQVAGIRKIENDVITTYYDIYDNLDAYTYSRINFSQLTESKVLFNAVFTDAGSVGTFHEAVITGAFNKDTTGSLSATLQKDAILAPATASKIQVTIDQYSPNQSLTYGTTANNSTFTSSLTTNWNSLDVKTDFNTNTNETTVTKDYAGSLKMLQE